MSDTLLIFSPIIVIAYIAVAVALTLDQGWPSNKAVFWPMPVIKRLCVWVFRGIILAIMDKE